MAATGHEPRVNGTEQPETMKTASVTGSETPGSVPHL